MDIDPSTAWHPVRPPLSARWDEWSALLRPSPRRLEGVVPSAVERRAAGAAGPVVVLPGLARGDGQTGQVRRHLAGLGFDMRGWGLGVDVGPTRRVLRGLEARLRAAAAHRPVNLVGFSMGGLFARWLAQLEPGLVRQVITVSSPFRSPLDSFFLPLRRVAPLWPCDMAAFLQAVERRPSVPSTCLYTETDGTVAWQSCLDPDRPDECFRYWGPHVPAARNPEAWALLAARLGRRS